MRSAIIAIMLFSLALNASCKDQHTENQMHPPITIEEISTLRKVSDVKKIGQARQMPVTLETNADMEKLYPADFARSKRAMASGRIMLVYWIKDKNDIIRNAVYVSFFYDEKEYIVGRQIVIEDNNVDR